MAGFSLQRFVFLLENFSKVIRAKTISNAIKDNPILLFKLPSIIQFSVIPVDILGIFNNSTVPSSFITSMHIKLIPVMSAGIAIGNATLKKLPQGPTPNPLLAFI